jgi:carbon-monoxide dehydrogenase large subunit/6-hydroxypseudooxynicotine dehydrogenase subunit gamma
MAVIGRSVPRLEDGPLVTGCGRFAADIAFAHMLHMRLARSTHAHGRTVSIDAEAARGVPGVEAVWTFADVGDIPPIDFRLTRIEGLAPYRQPILARPCALCRRARGCSIRDRSVRRGRCR